MGFRDFITNRLFRRRMAEDFERHENLKPPSNLSREYTDKLVAQLFDAETAWDAKKELSMIGARAVPSLAAALADPLFKELESKGKHSLELLEVVLELLVPHAPEPVLSAALPLVTSPSEGVRKTAALQIASLGRSETIPVLNKLLEDSEGYVRSYVEMGVGRALSAGRCNDDFRQAMYAAFLNQCDQDWGSATNDAAEIAIALDTKQAAVDFASTRWLATDNRCVYRILQACNDAQLLLPESLIRPLLDRSLPLAVGERCYQHKQVVAGSLVALTRCIGEGARPLLEASLASDQEEIRMSAATGFVMLAGIDDPIKFVLRQVRQVGFDGLTTPQRVVYCGTWFDAEVCNGGIMQFFGNGSGSHAVETLEALQVLGHPEGHEALQTAMMLVGPLSREPDQAKRLTAFEGRYDELQDHFEPLQNAFYKTHDLLQQSMLIYAVANAEHFRNQDVH